LDWNEISYGLEDCVAWGVMVDMLEGIWMILAVVEHWTRVEVPMRRGSKDKLVKLCKQGLGTANYCSSTSTV
jgi:hypothetical protein